MWSSGLCKCEPCRNGFPRSSTIHHEMKCHFLYFTQPLKEDTERKGGILWMGGAQSRLQRGGTGGGLRKNTRCHCVRIQMWAQPVMSFTSPTPPRVIRRAAFLRKGHKEPPCSAALHYWLISLWPIGDFSFFFRGVSKWWLISVFYLCGEWSLRQTRAPLVSEEKGILGSQAHGSL